MNVSWPSYTLATKPVLSPGIMCFVSDEDDGTLHVGQEGGVDLVFYAGETAAAPDEAIVRLAVAYNGLLFTYTPSITVKHAGLAGFPSSG